MNTKETLLLVWILVVVAASFLLHYFWGYAFQALENCAAFRFVSLPGLAKFSAGLFGIHFLS